MGQAQLGYREEAPDLPSLICGRCEAERPGIIAHLLFPCTAPTAPCSRAGGAGATYDGKCSPTPASWTSSASKCARGNSTEKNKYLWWRWVGARGREREGRREIDLLGSICKMEIKSVKVNTLEDVQRIVKKKKKNHPVFCRTEVLT